jgi:hypothetical protein
MSFRLNCLSLVASTIAFFPLLAGPVMGADAKTQTYDIFEQLQSLKIAPNTEAIARRQGYVFQGIQTGAADAKPKAGDTVMALVELRSFDGKLSPSQWIIRLQLAARSSAEAVQSNPGGFTEFTNTGEKFTFSSGSTGMKLESLGPINADTRPDQMLVAKFHEIAVATDFLSLDLYRAGQVVWRLNARPAVGPRLQLNFGTNPFSSEEVSLQRPRAIARKLTAADLRSLCGSLPALLQFLAIVQQTPDLQSILFQVLDKPSIIDVFRSGAQSNINFNFQGSGPSEGQEIFWTDAKREDFGFLTFNLEVFGKPVLYVVIYVTTPRPPLLTSAGIVGLVACSPSKPDKVVVVRVLSATEGAVPPGATKRVPDA